MHALTDQSALWRGWVSLAGTWLGGAQPQAGVMDEETGEASLVTWAPGARSRREDELARCRQRTGGD